MRLYLLDISEDTLPKNRQLASGPLSWSLARERVLRPAMDSKKDLAAAMTVILKNAAATQGWFNFTQ
jgi:hypothetical protein